MPKDPIVNDHYGDVLWRLIEKFKQNIIGKVLLTQKLLKMN